MCVFFFQDQAFYSALFEDTLFMNLFLLAQITIKQSMHRTADGKTKAHMQCSYTSVQRALSVLK